MSTLFGGFEAFVLLLIVLAVAALWSTIKMVPQGYNYTVETFGRYTRTLSPGWRPRWLGLRSTYRYCSLRPAHLVSRTGAGTWRPRARPKRPGRG